MELQRFVTSVIEAMGGIVEPIEYALCSVLVPDEYSSMFQGRTELLLSFDFEVAAENPESEFITTGSFLLEEMVNFAGSKAVSAIRHVIVDQLTLGNPAEKIKNFLNLDREQVDILEFRKASGAWVEFNYMVGYTSNERIEDNRKVWINLQTGKVDLKIMANSLKIFYSGDGDTNYPLCSQKDILAAFEESFEYIREDAQNSSSLQGDKLELDRELIRIGQYYDELLRENSKKMERKGISLERIRELGEKSKALKLEKERQQNEMMYKYSTKIDISLEYGVLYFIPLIEYVINIRSKGESREEVIYYNPILKEFQR